MVKCGVSFFSRDRSLLCCTHIDTRTDLRRSLSLSQEKNRLPSNRLRNFATELAVHDSTPLPHLRPVTSFRICIKPKAWVGALS